MRILVHDYSGHPFQVQLSRALAQRGHDVLHVHCSSYQTGKGAVAGRPGDPVTFQTYAIDLGQPFDRYAPIHRLRQEIAYGAAFTRRAAAFAPDVVLSSNDPLFAKARAARWCRSRRVPWVFWLQDVYSAAMAGYAGARLGAPGRVLGRGFDVLEGRLARQAASVVAITADFTPALSAWGVPPQRCHVVENWAPLEDLEMRPRDNPWARGHGLDRSRVLLYSGTLGLKHDPRLLLDLAQHYQGSDVQVVVISEGVGADWLAGEKRSHRLDSLLLLPYQPFELLADVLASADVLLALLDPDAGVFSVPSKILTYLCAGRPLLAAIPGQNLAARTIEQSGAGVTVPPGDSERFVREANSLLDDAELRRVCGRRARAYAERCFDIDAISDRFEAILASAAATLEPRQPHGLSRW